MSLSSWDFPWFDILSGTIGELFLLWDGFLFEATMTPGASIFIAHQDQGYFSIAFGGGMFMQGKLPFAKCLVAH